MKADYLVYAIMGREYLKGTRLEEAVERAVSGGATIVQIREKNANLREFYTLTLEALSAAKRLGVPLIVNDRVDVMLAAGADGVHVGQEDLPASAVRRIIGTQAILGVSAGTMEEVLAAERDGADYLGVGSVFATGTKADAGEPIGLDELRRICLSARSPVVAIGGITPENAGFCLRAGAVGVAACSSIFACEDIEEAARRMKTAASQGIRR